MLKKNSYFYCLLLFAFFCVTSNVTAGAWLNTKTEGDLYGDGIINSSVESFFEEDGMPIRDEYDNDNDGTIDQINYHTWDTSERTLITETDDNCDGTIEYTTQCIWANDCDLTVTRLYAGELSENNLISITYYTYDNDHHCIKSEEDSDGDGDIDDVVYSTYDDQGYCIKEEYDNDNDGDIDITTDFTNDDLGNVISTQTETAFVVGGITYSTIVYVECINTYDDNGNLIKVEASSSDDSGSLTFSSICYHEYEYFDAATENDCCWDTGEDSDSDNDSDSAEYSIYFPHIAANSTWDTEICVINKDDTNSLTGELLCYDNSGTQLGTLSVSLQPNGRIEIDVASTFLNSEDIGYIVFESDTEDMAGYTKFYQENKYGAAIPACTELNSEDIYISHIASNAKWWTGISLLNTTTEEKTLTLEFDDGTTKTKTISSREHQVYSIKSLFGGVSQTGIKSAILKNCDGVIGLELFGSTETIDDSYLSGILLKDDTSSSIYYPHIASNETWWTGIVAYNPSLSTNSDLTITPYKSDGTALTQTTISIEPQEKYIGTATALNFPEESAWFKISASQPIVGFELFGTNDGQQLGGYTGVNINRSSGVFAKIENSNGWTGIAFVNTNNSSCTVTLNAYNDSGDLISTSSIDLDSYEKKVGLAPSLFLDDISSATFISYTSTKQIVGFQLNSSADDIILDALPGM